MKTVLVIDDDAGFRESLTGVLKHSGYHALEAADGREALATIERLPTEIDLMIVDLALPEISGLEIIGAVTRREATIKILAISGVFDEMYLDMVKTLGADESLRKEALGHPEKWLEIVRRLLGETEDAVARPPQRVVLLVDDETIVRTYVRRLLQLNGYQVLEAADGVDALALLRKVGGAVDVLVTDVKMPRMTGKELVEVARKEFPNIAVVLISGDCLLEDLQLPRQRVVFVQKPFTPEALLKAMAEFSPKISVDSAAKTHSMKKTG